MSKTLQGHCTKLNKNKKTKRTEHQQSVVACRQQLYCYIVQYCTINNHNCLIIVKRRTRKVQSSARDVTVSDDAFLTDNGRLFHARAEATGKARSQSIECLVDGTTSMPMDIKF